MGSQSIRTRYRKCPSADVMTQNSQKQSLITKPCHNLKKCVNKYRKNNSLFCVLLTLISFQVIISNYFSFVGATIVESTSLNEEDLPDSSSSSSTYNKNHNNKIQIYKLHEIIQKYHKNKPKQPNRLLYLYGSGFGQGGSSDIDFVIRPTFSEHTCNYTTEPLQIISRDEHNLILSLDGFSFGKQSRAYLCATTDDQNQKKLHHWGIASKFESPTRISRSTLPDKSDFKTTPDNGLRIDGLRIEHSSKEPQYGDDGVPSLLSGSDVVIRLFGSGFTSTTVIAFIKESNIYGGSCIGPDTKLFPILNESISDKTALFKIVLPQGYNQFYICAKNDDSTNQKNFTLTKPLVHQGSESWLRLNSYENILPIWASIIIVIVCLVFSALFSGLNLGLMSLDRTELKILRNTGTEKEKKYASKIQPVRDHGNYLLCSILLGNVLVNSTFTILLDGLTSGLVAVIFSTIAIVVFGEITPQAICSRHGLAVGAKTIYITKAVMFITFPLSYPTSKILDFCLGEEIGNVYNRERLKELVRVTTGINDLDKDEVNIISGALELRKKTVGDVMTHIEDAFMLSLDAILDFETVSEIMKSGFSRIPVHEDDRKNIVTLLYIKDLAFVDPDDNTPLKTLCEFYQNPCHFVFEDVTLDVMFKQFKEGNKGHMAFVHRVNSEGDGDPFYETIGLVTLEDVIEELIQAEIMDETDVFTDNRTKVKRQRTKKQDFTIFAERRENQRIRISPQLTLATFQYLSTTIDAFRSDIVSDTILRRLLNQDIIHNLKCKGKDKNDPIMSIYQQGKPVDFFVLILEGRVEVTVGRENLVFESGPFTYFGIQALVQNVVLADSPNQIQQVMGSLQSLNMDAMLRHTFVPDYSVRAITDVIYIAIKRTLYLAAKRATLMERSQKVGESGSEPIDDEVEKLLYSLDEDDRSIGAHTAILHSTTPKNQSKPNSNTPSPTLPSVSINLTRRKNQIGQKNDHVMYAKEAILNGPTPISPDSLANMIPPQHSSQRSNSLGVPAQIMSSILSASAGVLPQQQQPDGSTIATGFISAKPTSASALGAPSSSKSILNDPAGSPLLPRSKS